MSRYAIFTDSGSDLTKEECRSWDVHLVSLSLMKDGESEPTSMDGLDLKKFYSDMREGAVFKTSAANPDMFQNAFRPVLEQGKDILYIAFSSGLSMTYQAAVLAAEQLQEEYPDRKILCFDTLCASAGFGLVVDLVCQRRDQGATIEELYAYVQEIAPRMCHWFTVDDLEYLKRGGRVSASAAFVGGILGIKPVLHMDDEGHLISKLKVRGRRASIRAILKQYEALAVDPFAEPVCICHADCLHDAEELQRNLLDSYGIHVCRIVDIGPIIGSHSGPGTLALFFLGKER